MLAELANLSKLQAALRLNRETLIDHVERDPQCNDAWLCVSLISGCQLLERDVATLTKMLLELQPPAGAS